MKKTILLVEDDRWLAESYQRVLEKAGYMVLATELQEEAITLIEQHMPHVIIADIMLDTNTVWPLLHELQTYDDTRRIPIVLCSGLDHPALLAENLHSYGVARVLQKATLTPEELVAAVREVGA